MKKTHRTFYKKAELPAFDFKKSPAVVGILEGLTKDDACTWVMRAARGTLRVVVTVPLPVSARMSTLVGRLVSIQHVDNHWKIQLTKQKPDLVEMNAGDDPYRQWDEKQ